MRFNSFHLINPEERQKTRVNPKNLLTHNRVKTPKTPMLGEKIKERRNTIACYIRRTTSPNTSLAFPRFINPSSEGDFLPNQ
jgi:hypothetical protein